MILFSAYWFISAVWRYILERPIDHILNSLRPYHRSGIKSVKIYWILFPFLLSVGLGIHVYKKLLFVSDSSGDITRSSIVKYEGPLTILTAAHLNFMPLDLSVDWLNDHLYILGEVNHSTGPRWQIARCQFDGKGVTVAVAGLLTKPLHIEVDPYNGYVEMKKKSINQIKKCLYEEI